MPRPIELACCTLSCCVRMSSGRPPRPVTNVSKPAENNWTAPPTGSLRPPPWLVGVKEPPCTAVQDPASLCAVSDMRGPALLPDMANVALLRAEHERLAESRSLRARARGLLKCSRVCFFVAALVLFSWSELHYLAPELYFAFVIAVAIGAIIGGIAFDERGWAWAALAGSACLSLGAVCLVGDSIIFAMEQEHASPPLHNGTMTVTNENLEVVGRMLSGVGAGMLYPVAGILALAREKAGGRPQHRVAKAFAMQWAGQAAAVLAFAVCAQASSSLESRHIVISLIALVAGTTAPGPNPSPSPSPDANSNPNPNLTTLESPSLPSSPAPLADVPRHLHTLLTC
jgi:hypothetical protein